MPRAAQTSIRRSIRLALLGVVGSVVLTAILLHGFLREREADRVADSQAMTVAEVMATQFPADVEFSPEELQAACNRLISNSSVLAIALFDQTGSKLAAAPQQVDLLSAIEIPVAGVSGGTSIFLVEVPSGDGISQSWVRRVDVPLGLHVRSDRPGRLAMLVRPPTGFWFPPTYGWLFRLPLLLAGLLGSLVFSLWARREVVGPISHLARAAKDGKLGDARVSPTLRQDEIGLIARALLELLGELNQWRDRANRIERSLDSRVAEETKTIHRDLKKTQREVWQDPLTGVRNRRLLDEKFEEMFEAQRKEGLDLSVVMVDLDHFKSLNDTLGHGAGDDLLMFVGELMLQCLRADDTPIRYGGDEFVMILPGVSAEHAKAVTERIMALFSQRARLLEVTPKPSMSAGIASLFNNVPASHQEVLELADKALYEAKRSGKSQVKICQSIERLAPL